MKHLKHCLSAVVALLFAASLTAQTTPTKAKPATKTSLATSTKSAAPVKITSVEGITEYKLANGMKGVALSGYVKTDHYSQYYVSGRVAK